MCVLRLSCILYICANFEVYYNQVAIISSFDLIHRRQQKDRWHIIFRFKSFQHWSSTFQLGRKTFIDPDAGIVIEYDEEVLHTATHHIPEILKHELML